MLSGLIAAEKIVFSHKYENLKKSAQSVLRLVFISHVRVEKTGQGLQMTNCFSSLPSTAYVARKERRNGKCIFSLRESKSGNNLLRPTENSDEYAMQKRKNYGNNC